MIEMTAIILAAGKGERLKPLTALTPKPLIAVSGQTLLERNINCLAESGVKKIIVNGSRMEIRLNHSSGIIMNNPM